MTLTEGTEKLAEALLLPINPAAVIILGIYTVVWGLWVANPFSDAFDNAVVYHSLASHFPEYFWGLVAVAVGLVTVYGAVKRKYRPLVRGAAVACLFWLIIAIFYFIADWTDVGGITALIFAVYSGFIYLNIRVNFKDDHKSPFLLDPPKFQKRGK